MTTRLFGTDGIRGAVNTFPMVPELVCAVGRAVARILGAKTGSQVLVGTDTRESADMLAYAAAAGICSGGGSAVMAGVLPTPAVARLAAETDADAAMVVSASHNPFSDNGIKLFDGRGFKLGDDLEGRIEEKTLQFFSGDGIFSARQEATVGRVRRLEDGESRYLAFLKRNGPILDGMKLVLDCANGAAYRIGPQLLKDLGADLITICATPDGRNINDGCGSEHPEQLAAVVAQNDAALGLALDGDADRLVVVDDTGAVVTGDQIIAVCAEAFKRQGRLPGNRVITTVMSNLGLGLAMAQLGIEHRTTAVGDRQVLQEMKRYGAVLGGEDSGHLVFLDAHTTGDGLFAALRLLDVVRETGKPVSQLKTVMTVYPQVLMNVSVSRKPPLSEIETVQQAIREVERALGDQGRVLVRYSGTQPLCRVMVEGPTESKTQQACEWIAREVADAVGK